MKRLGLIAFLALAFAFAIFAQEHPPGEPEGNLEWWKWANFVILAGVLGWLISKNAPQFFQTRTEEIQKGIATAGKLKRDAEERAAKVELRMASLQSEIEHLRADSKAEMAKEADRLRQETERFIARIQTRGEQEIVAISKHVEKDLRAFSAQLAIQLAEERIRARMSGKTQSALFDGFLSGLDRGASSPGTRL